MIPHVAGVLKRMERLIYEKLARPNEERRRLYRYDREGLMAITMPGPPAEVDDLADAT